MTSEPIPEDILERAALLYPYAGYCPSFKLRGINVDREKNKGRPGNFKCPSAADIAPELLDDISKRTRDGLNRRLKERLGSDQE